MFRFTRGYVVVSSIALAGCYTGADGEQSASGSADEGTNSGPTASGSGTADDDGGTETDGVESNCEDLDPGVSLVRRLTAWEYNNTISTIFGVDVGDVIDSSWPDELHAAGFSNTANALIVSFDHVEVFMELSQAVVDRVDWPALLATHASCTDMTDECQRGFTRSLGEVLFRGPLEDDVVAAYAAPFGAAQAEGEGFQEGAQLVLRSMLQSARFLYRLEEQEGPQIRQVTDTSWPRGCRTSSSAGLRIKRCATPRRRESCRSARRWSASSPRPRRRPSRPGTSATGCASTTWTTPCATPNTSPISTPRSSTT